jgi:hypothetical protein
VLVIASGDVAFGEANTLVMMVILVILVFLMGVIDWFVFTNIDKLAKHLDPSRLGGDRGCVWCAVGRIGGAANARWPTRFRNYFDALFTLRGTSIDLAPILLKSFAKINHLPHQASGLL